jgi:hypothetical protein
VSLLKKRRYVSIDDAVFNSVAFKTLPAQAAKLWLDLRTQFNGRNNGRIVATLSKLRQRGWNSNDTLKRARDELVRRGLLRYTRRCGPNVFHRASMLAFTDLPIPDNEEEGVGASGATHDYKKWQPEPKPKKKRAHRETVFDDTVTRFTTEPAFGEQHAKTAPDSGDRENDSEPAPILGLGAISGHDHSLTASR